MGPTNAAMVKLSLADQKLREAQSRLDAVSKDVRVQQRRVNDLSERLRLSQAKLKELQSSGAQLDLDLKSREVRIERLRSQQQSASNQREYQAFLLEINTEKVEIGKVEEQLLKVMEEVEKQLAETGELGRNQESEKAKLASIQAQVGGRMVALQAEVAALEPQRAAAAAEVPSKARDAFERLAERFDGEALSAVAKPDRRREEYACSACNMDLVTDVYNKLHTRDDLVFCPSCHRILYIPDDLPVELAVNKTKERKEPRSRSAGRASSTSGAGAAMNRQQSAVDVMNSITPEPDEPEAAAVQEQASEQTVPVPPASH